MAKHTESSTPDAAALCANLDKATVVLRTYLNP
jgi:hypothetical protein